MDRTVFGVGRLKARVALIEKEREAEYQRKLEAAEVKRLKALSDASLATEAGMRMGVSAFNFPLVAFYSLPEWKMALREKEIRTRWYAIQFQAHTKRAKKQAAKKPTK